MPQITEATLHAVENSKTIVKVGLNGYKSFSKRPTGDNPNARLIWSFTVLEGDRDTLMTHWSQSKPLILHTSGNEVPVRVIAFPVERDSFGMIEFI